MDIVEVDQSKKEEIIIGEEDKELFCQCVVEGTWKPVVAAYQKYSDFHKIKINKSRGTALHVAVKDGKQDVVASLVGSIIKHEGENVGSESALKSTNEQRDTHVGSESALKSTNEQRDTPLHLAALRGFTRMCECIIGKNGERKDLIEVKNVLGETPLSLAVLTYQKQTFMYLHHVSRNINVPFRNKDGVPFRNKDGDSILHCAIRSEFFDLAIIITHCYPELMDMHMRNKNGETPLKVLATRPSAFESGCNFSWWKQILYYCISVEPVDAEKAMNSYLEKTDGSGALNTKIVDQIQLQADISGFSEELLNYEKEAQLELQKALKYQDEFWKEKSHFNWHSFGDRNTAFCHKVSKIINASKQLSMLQQGDRILDQQEDIEQHVLDYYKNLFASENICTSNDLIDSMISLMVTIEDNLMLTNLPTKEEVRSVVFSMNACGAPSPDGFGDCFFQHFWDLISHDVFNVVTQFFIQGIDQSQISIHLLPELQTSLVSEKEENAAYTLVPPNCATCIRFAHCTLQFVYSSLGLSRLGISGVAINAIREIKQKNKWGSQLLSIFMEKPYESYMGQRGDQPFMEDDGTPFLSRQQLVMLEKEQIEDQPFMEDEGTGQPYLSRQQLARLEKEQKEASTSTVSEEQKDDALLAVARNGIDELQKIRNALPWATSEKKSADPRETAFLAAAKNGIVEIVKELLNKIPSALHDTTSDKENVLLVAVKNRQPLVVEELRKNLDSDIFNSLILGVDNEKNTVLHLAAGALRHNKKTWQIAGAAMQMMWDIKWYQYIKDQVPAHLIFRNNKEEKTAGEIFKEKHEDLVKDGAEWLKETSESCSVVAALIAGVSFATSSSVPGGNKEDTGKPALEGQPAFDTFAIASLIGLFFSVTALIMFLSILTSRKQAKDFRKDQLPLKLLLGLSSLIVSITSMLVSFCAGHFLVLKDKYRHILFPVYLATCLPVTFYAVAQFPLYADLVKAIVTKVPHPSDKGADL